MIRPTGWWWIRHAPVPGSEGRLNGQREVDCDTSDQASFQVLAALLPGDAVAARLVNTACLRFSHPRLIVEFEQDTEPTLDQMIGFCLAALATQPV